MARVNMGQGITKVQVKQEDLEDSISGLNQFKPILQMQVIRGNGGNARQAAIDSAQLAKHFDTAIDAMTMLLLSFPDYLEAMAKIDGAAGHKEENNGSNQNRRNGI